MAGKKTPLDKFIEKAKLYKFAQDDPEFDNYGIVDEQLIADLERTKIDPELLAKTIKRLNQQRGAKDE